MAKRLPEDVKQICLWLVRGYDRRREGSARRVKEKARIEAVERALVAVGSDITADDIRKQLQEAIMLNAKSGRKYPFEVLHLDGVSRSDFYRRKAKFLEDIAKRMGLI